VLPSPVSASCFYSSYSVIAVHSSQIQHPSPHHERRKLTLGRNNYSSTTTITTKPPTPPRSTTLDPLSSSRLYSRSTRQHARECHRPPIHLPNRPPILTPLPQIKNAQSALLSNHELLLHLRAEEAEYTGTDDTSRNRKKPVGLNHMLRDVIPPPLVPVPFSAEERPKKKRPSNEANPTPGPRVPRDSRLHDVDARLDAPRAPAHPVRGSALAVPRAGAKVPPEQGRVSADVQPAARDAGHAGAGH
jgi:hypothetical protein